MNSRGDALGLAAADSEGSDEATPPKSLKWGQAFRTVIRRQDREPSHLLEAKLLTCSGTV